MDQHRRNKKANELRKPRAQSVFMRPFEQARTACLLARRLALTRAASTALHDRV